MSLNPHQPTGHVFRAPNRINRAIAIARERFVSDGSVPEAVIRPEIAAAWQRSFLHGVRPTSDRAPSIEDSTRWCRTQLSSEFGTVALEVLASHEPLLEGTGSVLVLAECSGNIFHVVGDAATRRGLETINFMPGGTWDEDLVGPNGIGTPLRAGRAGFVFGNEHYCVGWQPWACFGSPVRDPETAQTLGVVDLTCPASQARPELLVMVSTLAQTITHALHNREMKRRETVVPLFHERAQRCGNDGLILLNRAGRVMIANAAARQLLGAGTAEPVGRPLLPLLPPSVQRALRNVRIDAQATLERDVEDGMVRAIRLEPLRDSEPRLAGYLLTLKARSRVEMTVPSAAVAASVEEGGARRSLRASTNELIRRTLEECDGEVGRAARRLGIARSTLYRRLKQQASGDAGLATDLSGAINTNDPTGG